MKKNKYVRPLRDMSVMLFDMLKSDRDTNIGIGGFTGEGKSSFLTHLFKDYGIVSGMGWSFNLLTWSRKELLLWIDGDKKSEPDEDGLLKGQKPEYSALGVDELFLLFYKRNWYDEGQIDSIGTLNMCRDRHLLIGGNIPNFWDLDSAFTSRIRFYVYIPYRGVAWVFEQENNPFAIDKWNVTQNKNIFRKFKNPYMCPNFLMEIHYPDWSPKEKIRYYEIRNKKRVKAIDVNKSDKQERYKDIKSQRDRLIKLLLDWNNDIIQYDDIKERLGIEKLTYKDLSDILGISPSAVRLIALGER